MPLVRWTLPGLAVLLCLATITSRPVIAAGHKTSAVKIYLVNIHGKGLSCGGGLVSVVRRIPPTRAPLTAALRQLLANRHPCGEAGPCSAFANSRLTIRRVAVVHGVAVIHFSGALYLGGVCDAPRVRGQLRATALQFPAVHTVSVYINGRPLDRVLSPRGNRGRS
ncbi:MAG TPA: GerMN domain-containing protein [Chloroflexota bacterium]|nr:GerMN domain-containing protein [Chloroflexota bacterium]